MHGEESFKDVMNIYKSSKLVLANRFHANVCSMGLDVPTIGLVNYRQIKELYNEIGSSNYVDITKCGFEELLNVMVEKMLIQPSYESSKILNKIHNDYVSSFSKIDVWLNSKNKLVGVK